jgi:transaldolase
MFERGDDHVEVLTASVRNLNHLLYAISLGSDIITSPFKILKEWAEKRISMPDASYSYPARGLEPIPYQEVPLDRDWQEYDLRHELTDKGMEKFSEDWNALIK